MELHPEFVFTIYNIHRLLITSIMLAVKFHEDFYYSNSFYAKVGGLPLPELNHLEVQFLLFINFELTVVELEYRRKLKEMLEGLDHASRERYLEAMASEENTTVSTKFCASRTAKKAEGSEDRR